MQTPPPCHHHSMQAKPLKSSWGPSNSGGLPSFEKTERLLILRQLLIRRQASDKLLSKYGQDRTPFHFKGIPPRARAPLWHPDFLLDSSWGFLCPQKGPIWGTLGDSIVRDQRYSFLSHPPMDRDLFRQPFLGDWIQIPHRAAVPGRGGIWVPITGLSHASLDGQDTLVIRKHILHVARMCRSRLSFPATGPPDPRRVSEGSLKGSLKASLKGLWRVLEGF